MESIQIVSYMIWIDSKVSHNSLFALNRLKESFVTFESVDKCKNVLKFDKHPKTLDYVKYDFHLNLGLKHEFSKDFMHAT